MNYNKQPSNDLWCKNRVFCASGLAHPRRMTRMSPAQEPVPILLIEDDPLAVLLVKRALSDAGFANPLHVFDGATTARDFVTEHQTSPPAMVLLDLTLRGPDTGFDFLRWLRKQPSPIDVTPAIVLTASDKAEDKRTSKQLGALRHIRKPIAPAELVDAMHDLGLVIETKLVSGEVRFEIAAPVADSEPGPAARKKAAR